MVELIMVLVELQAVAVEELDQVLVQPGVMEL